ncbi:bacteriohemerythrin [Carboxylicivirga sp. M1479]|uniref:bacteriohemerythrin n=1 Tax=Carboxylicivirga sp. M1479 TaxID=2594476 RepID=UPI001177C566|nr:hemerythrin family protein [Carboxylicivirga sp. M1479]TRX70240.1 bacteriohemerythrin [Carboxylicivirga sp. M1479]
MITNKIIEWKTEYEVGNYDIDAEHRIFINIIRKISNAYYNQSDTQTLDDLVHELIKYTEFHFCSEENLMKAIDYPDFNNHRQIHSNLLLKLKDEINIVMAKHINFDILIDFLVDWFIKHTTMEDQKLANYITQIHVDKALNN